MQYRATILAVLSLFPVMACAPSHPPKPDPFKDEVIILQKQYLELQRLLVETKARLDESNAALNALSGKVRMLEERQAVGVRSRSGNHGKARAASLKKQHRKKKTVKKAKKKVRRQE